MLNEKGLCKILKAAYKGGGYTVMPVVTPAAYGGGRGINEIVINGATWAVRCETCYLPKAAAVQIVEDAGYLPVEAMTICKGEPNQMVMENVAAGRHGILSRQAEGSVAMEKIPVIYKERWQLYQTAEGEIAAFDTALLELIDPKCTFLSARLSASGGLGIFTWDDCSAWIAPGRFSSADEERLRFLAGLDWAGQMEDEDATVNMSLFDPDRDVVPVSREG